jgi:hypothetical protein
VKFLVNRDGQAVARYKPGYDPLDFEADVSDSAHQHCWQLQCWHGTGGSGGSSKHTSGALPAPCLLWLQGRTPGDVMAWILNCQTI